MTTNNPPKKRKLMIWLIVLGILILPLAILLLIDYIHYAKDPDPYKTFLIPRMEVGVFEVNNLDLDKTTLTGQMLIHSPLPFNLRADSLEYKVFIGGEEVIKSTYAKSVNIKKWDSTWIQLPITTYTDKLTKVLKGAEERGEDSIDYKVQTSFDTKFIVNRHIDMEVERRLPLIYIPEVKMEKVVWDSLNLEGVTLYLHTAIVNKNAFPLTFKDLTFKFALADNPWIKGSKGGVIDIPDSSVVPLVLPLRVSFKEIGQSIGPLIRQGKNTDYKFNMNLKLVSDNNAMKNSVVVLKGDGVLKEITKLAKEQKEEAKAKEEALEARGISKKEQKKDKPKLKIEKKQD